MMRAVWKKHSFVKSMHDELDLGVGVRNAGERKDVTFFKDTFIRERECA